MSKMFVLSLGMQSILFVINSSQLSKINSTLPKIISDSTLSISTTWYYISGTNNFQFKIQAL